MRNHVLIASTEFPPGPGGIGNHAYCLAMGLHKASYRVGVVTRTRDSEQDSKHDENLPFSIHRIPADSILKRTGLILKMIHQHIKKSAGGTVIASGLAMLVICGMYALLRGGKDVRFVLVAHGIDINPRSYFVKLLVSCAMQGFQVVVPVSSFTAEKIKRVKRDRLMVINNGFDPEKFAGDEVNKAVQKKGNPSLITVGSVTYRKGQINVIQALPALQETFPDVHYHVVGLDKEKPQLMILARELGVESRVTFHGALDDRLLKAHLEVADIFLMLSNHDPSGDFEGFGIAVLEANYLGLPAIGSENSGLRDAIRSGYSGRLIDPGKPTELILAIQEILTDYSRYKMQAKEHATHFIWEKVIKKYIAILNTNT